MNELQQKEVSKDLSDALENVNSIALSHHTLQHALQTLTEDRHQTQDRLAGMQNQFTDMKDLLINEQVR